MQPYETLSQIDCGIHIEKKGNLSYLSWAWAVTVLLEKYPGATWSFEQDPEGSELFTYPDGTGEVRCTVAIEEIVRNCSLPVMDNRNKAVTAPDARQVNDTKMRCLAKCIAMHGLGLYIYAGEDVPGNSVSSEMADFLSHINGSREQVTEYLRDKQVIGSDQQIEDMPPAKLKKALARPRDLVKAAVEHYEDKQEVVA